MLHIEDKGVRDLLLTGNFGLEKESLRITKDGHLSHAPHPFSQDDKQIVRDFCENQTEINTGVSKSADGVLAELHELNTRIYAGIRALPEPELLWPFSNPPYIKDEEDIPVAQFFGDLAEKTEYRLGLSKKYGRYKMALSGIHFNYSFSGDLLRRNYEAETGRKVEHGDGSFGYRSYEDRLYLDLAENAMAFGWVLVALTAASPVLDSSYFTKGEEGCGVFTGMSSVRCSELGYWNFFTPVLNYGSREAYAGSAGRYVTEGLIEAPSEFYYPVRLKPRGKNSLDSIKENGINHIELRSIDLNPFAEDNIDLRDIKFAQLLIVWLASIPGTPLRDEEQVLAVQNYKTAAHFDLRTVKISFPGGRILPADEAVSTVLGGMLSFYQEVFHDSPEKRAEAEALLRFELAKIEHPEEYSYAWRARREYGENFVKDGLRLARLRAESHRG